MKRHNIILLLILILSIGIFIAALIYLIGKWQYKKQQERENFAAARPYLRSLRKLWAT